LARTISPSASPSPNSLSSSQSYHNYLKLFSYLNGQFLLSSPSWSPLGFSRDKLLATREEKDFSHFIRIININITVIPQQKVIELL